MNPESITIFTDGSSRGNPGQGGWGAVLAISNLESRTSKEKPEIRIIELGGRETYTTNNKMELTAALEALRVINNFQFSIFKITIYTDSAYLVNGITKWVFGWQKNGWKTKEKKDVENRELWEELIRVSRGKKITWNQVSGHVGVVGNERCDEIATAFADGNTPSLYSGPMSAYPIQNVFDMKENASSVKDKSASRAHSRAKAYSYVSLVGGKIEVHGTWPECEARVKGKSARFKKATSKEEEQALIREWSTA